MKDTKFVKYLVELSKRAKLIRNDGDYEQDGILYCGVCKEPKQKIVKFQDVTLCPTIQCRCQREQEKAEKEKLDREIEELEREKRRRGIKRIGLRDCRLSSDDGRQPGATRFCQKYINHFSEMFKNGYGVLFYGDNDKGKTFYAACIANELIDKGYSVILSTMADMILDKLDAMHNKEEFSLSQYHLVVIDDFGVERLSPTAFSIIDELYANEIPMIVTTNLTPDDLREPPNVEAKRIYSRIIEACPAKVLINNSGSRKDQGKAKRDEMYKILTENNKDE